MKTDLKDINLNALLFSSMLTNVSTGYFQRVRIEVAGITNTQLIEIPEKAIKLATLFHLTKN